MSNTDAAADPGAAPPPAKSGKMGTIIGLVLATAIAVGAGAGLGTMLAGAIEAAVTAKVKEVPEKPPAPPAKYAGDLVVRDLKPIITNLAVPSTTWIRLEAAIIFTNGSVENPDIVASEIEQDLLAYARTLTLEQLTGASAFEHLRDDLNERVSIRTEGAVKELVLKTMVMQ